MPSIILDDFLNDIKIELQLAHKSSVDDKNLDMIHKVFGQIKKLKKERDFFESEFHKTLEHQANDCEEYEKQIENLKKEDPIKDCMNDIINQVDRREWLRVNEHRDRLVKKWKREKAKVEEMKGDWEVATEKIAQENSDLHNQIKKLKDELRVKHPVIFQKTYQKQRDEIEKLKFNLQRAEDALDEQMEKNEDLMEKLIDK